MTQSAVIDCEVLNGDIDSVKDERVTEGNERAGRLHCLRACNDGSGDHRPLRNHHIRCTATRSKQV